MGDVHECALLDLSVQKSFEIIRGQKATLRINVFNALNNNAVTARTVTSGANFGTVTNVLLPDILTFNTSSSAGFLNGRRLADDVIDTELSVISNGAITTDCVANDSTFSNTFPYLGAAN